MRTTFRIILLACLFFTVISCEKWRDNRENITAIDHETGFSTISDLYRVIVQSTGQYNASLDSYIGVTADPCATYTLNNNGGTFPKTLTIDFGVADCEDEYEIKRRGVVIASFNGPTNTNGTVATVTFENFYVNGFQLSGQLTITYGKSETTDLPTLTFMTTDNKVESESYEVNFLTTGNLVFEVTEGSNTINYSFDDVLKVTGTGSGLNREGRSYTFTIEEGLYKESICRWPKSGTTVLEPEDLKKNTVEYKNEDCDNNAILKFDDKDREHQLNLL